MAIRNREVTAHFRRGETFLTLGRGVTLGPPETGWEWRPGRPAPYPQRGTRPVSDSELADATGVTLGDGLVIGAAPGLGAEGRWFCSVLEHGAGWDVSITEADEEFRPRLALHLQRLQTLGASYHPL
jgi:hypothetical protein